MLYGIHSSTTDQVIADLQQMRRELHEQFDALQEREQQQSELLWRGFTRQWNFEMQRLEAECPNTFYLMSTANRPLSPQNWVRERYQLRLVCQHPPAPHGVGSGYVLPQSEEWWQAISPWLRELVKYLKYGVPVAGSTPGVAYSATALAEVASGIDLMEQITTHLPDARDQEDLVRSADSFELLGQHHQAIVPALRALFSFLEEVDPARYWGGLQRIVTPEGTILWLCETHRKTYEARPLILGSV
jgi:hypothetical protein